MKFRDLEGIIPYLVSPVDQKSGAVRTDTLTKLVKDLIDSGVHGLSPLGSTGEIHYLSWEQKVDIVKTVIQASEGKVPVVPGISAYTAEDAIEQINFFEKIGVEGIVLILNAYFPLSKSEILEFFSEVANSVACPIVLYNNPKLSGVDLTPDIVIKLSSIPNIKYFKDATGRTGRLLSVIDQVNDDIKVFSASAHIPLFVMQMGGVGWMAGPACIFPKESISLYELVNAGNFEDAYKLQKRLWKINEVFQKHNNLAACIKAALEIQGYDVGDPLLPFKPLDTKAKEEISDVINYITQD